MLFELIGYGVVIVLSAFAGYVRVKAPGYWTFYALSYGVAIAGVYFLSWWVLFPWFFGMVFGGYLGRLEKYVDDTDEES